MLTVQIADLNDLDGLVSNLEDHQIKTQVRYAHFARENQLRLMLRDQLRQDAHLGDCSNWMAMDEDGPAGLAAWKVLDWDSTQLGCKAARLEHLIGTGDYTKEYMVKSELLDAVLKEGKRQGIRHLSARTDASDSSTIHVLEQNGFVTVDGILTFSVSLSTHAAQRRPLDEGIRLRTARTNDIHELVDIARVAYVHNRFSTDPRLADETAARVYSTWTKNACLGKSADAVIVAESDNQVLSYVACKIERDVTTRLGFPVGIIVLVATAERARGKGFATAATQGALEWFADNGVSLVQVGTQISNIGGSRLYESCGFRLVASSLSLRRWIEDD